MKLGKQIRKRSLQLQFQRGVAEFHTAHTQKVRESDLMSLQTMSIIEDNGTLWVVIGET